MIQNLLILKTAALYKQVCSKAKAARHFRIMVELVRHTGMSHILKTKLYAKIFMFLFNYIITNPGINRSLGLLLSINFKVITPLIYPIKFIKAANESRLFAKISLIN